MAGIYRVPRAVIACAGALSLGAVAAIPLAGSPAATSASPIRLASARVCATGAGKRRHVLKRHAYKRHAHAHHASARKTHGTDNRGLGCEPALRHRFTIAYWRQPEHRHQTPSTTTTTPSTTTTTPSTTTTTPSTTTTTTTTTPTTTTPTGTNPTPNPLWNGDFSAGNWSQYDGSPAYHPDGNPADYSIVNSPTPSGFAHSFDATIESGTTSIKAGQSGERTLLTLWPDDGDGTQGLSRGYQGASTWYRDEIYFPASYTPTKNSDFNWVFEMHNFPDNEGDAMLSCGVDTSVNPAGPFSDGGGYGSGATPERFSCRIFGGGSPTYPFDSYSSQNWYQNPAVQYDYMIGLNSIPRGQWLDMVWHINWDWRSQADGGQGGVSWWINGQQVGSYTGPTLLYLSNAPGRTGGGANQAYLQDGLYRPTDSRRRVRAADDQRVPRRDDDRFERSLDRREPPLADNRDPTSQRPRIPTVRGR